MNKALDEIGGSRVVAYRVVMAHITGSVSAGLLLSQFWFWTNTLEEARDGWFWKTADEIFKELGMRRYETEQARECLRHHGLLREDKRGVPARLWYCIDKDRLEEMITNYTANKNAEGLQTRVQKVYKQGCRLSARKTVDRLQTITESTTKTTSKNTQKELNSSLSATEDTNAPDLVRGTFEATRKMLKDKAAQKKRSG